MPDSAKGGASAPADAAMDEVVELEHCIGFNAMRQGLFYHPGGEHYVYSAGASVVIASFHDPHDQKFLHGHDDCVSALAVSKAGTWIASGQHGENSDVAVWSFASRKLVYRLEEHDYGIASLAFSDDEKLLCTCGIAEDGKIILWDLCNGHIVTSMGANPKSINVSLFGGFARNIKRRETENYQLFTAGDKMVMWSINPYSGHVEGQTIAAEGRVSLVREISHAVFSDDLEWVYCATSTGDFLVVRVADLRIVRQVGTARLGLQSILSWPGGVVTGAGDGTISAYDRKLDLVGSRKIHGGVFSLSFSADSTEILVGGTEGHIYRLGQEALSQYGKVATEMTAEDENLLLLNVNPTGRVLCVAYAAGSSDFFATGSSDSWLRIWDANDYSVAVRVVVRDAGLVSCLEYTTDMLMSGWEDGVIRSHDSSTGAPLWHIDNAHRGGVSALALSHNARRRSPRLGAALEGAREPHEGALGTRLEHRDI
eukprot:scaffold343_cov245-Pinguiococcus_pyrenoidosus.AAC.33